MRKLHFDITGMSCAACSTRVEKAVCSLDGVRHASVNLLKNDLLLEFDENRLTSEAVVKAVTAAGYGASIREESDGKPRLRQGKSQAAQPSAQPTVERTRLYASLFFCALLMVVSMAPMAGLTPPVFDGVRKAPAFALTQLLLTLPVIFLNRHFFTRGFKALISRSPNMDTLVALGASASLAFGVVALYAMLYAAGAEEWEAVRHHAHQMYFDSAAMIITLVGLGKYLEARAKAKTTDEISKLVDLVPETARVIRNGTEVEIAADELALGDIVVVRTGERIAADGVVIEGSAQIDESALTGESMPVQKKVGSTVCAATTMRSGFLRLRATRVGEATMLAQVIALVDEATSSKAPAARLADRISGIFVPVVLVIALFTAIVWLAVGADADFAFTLAVSVLVISCPCALGLATPTAVTVGMGRAAHFGILFKSAEALERCSAVTAAVLDKTGTITEGSPVVTDIRVFTGDVSEKDILRFAASVEHKSEHPLAQAIVRCAHDNGLTLHKVDDFAQTPEGVRGRIEGVNWEIGSQRLAQSHAEVLSVVQSLAESGQTILVVCRNDRLVGLLACADTVKPDSAGAVLALKSRGLRVMMLTGDNARTAQAVAQAAGIDEVVSEVMPTDKAAVVRCLQRQGECVMMIGDGINDAPALAAADVGMAIGAGTDVAIDCADVVLVNSKLSDAVTACALSSAVLRNIKQNLFWAFFYNAAGIPLAAGVFYLSLGWVLNPMIAAAAMSLSSVCVVTNALRLRGFKSAFPTHSLPNRISHKVCAAYQLPCEQRSKTMEKVISIEGMHCCHCSGAVTKALSKLPGVTSVAVSLEDKRAVVVCEETVTDELLKATVADLDFTVTAITTKA